MDRIIDQKMESDLRFPSVQGVTARVVGVQPFESCRHEKGRDWRRRRREGSRGERRVLDARVRWGIAPLLAVAPRPAARQRKWPRPDRRAGIAICAGAASCRNGIRTGHLRSGVERNSGPSGAQARARESGAELPGAAGASTFGASAEPFRPTCRETAVSYPGARKRTRQHERLGRSRSGCMRIRNGGTGPEEGKGSPDSCSRPMQGKMRLRMAADVNPSDTGEGRSFGSLSTIRGVH